MQIAVYCPLKSPRHPVPSGDRLMARQLMHALKLAGHGVTLASELRGFIKVPEARAALEETAAQERARIATQWRAEGAPDAWFCYHPYYKAPDLLGPPLCREFALPYITAEASYSARRDADGWREAQAALIETLNAAAVNIALTERDRVGLMTGAPLARIARLKPFIAAAPFLEVVPQPHPGRLVTVAMMRPGDKMDSYHMLAEALHHLLHRPWTLSIIGDGALRGEVEALFAPLGPGRVIWHGALDPPQLAALLSTAALYVWPGCGEAYGLAYLEAQAAGLPVVAQAIAGVPEVVVDGRTGILTPPGDVARYAAAIGTLLGDEAQRQSFAAEARRFVAEERDMAAASADLAAILTRFVGLKISRAGA
ncbi:glycosyltransferase family 4 protein [Rhizobium sp. YIM 134829]|uniref:glycosyltransferase family 4 protein n=1 Tax=Rhizobium sp. YIM 134829 TaxID=3390453 RepID=UPI00397E275D